MLFLEPGEIVRLADAMDDRYSALVYLAAYSGCRFGEIAFLQVKDVNLLSGKVTVRGSLADINGKLIQQPTKTSKKRVVTLPRGVSQLVGEHLGRFPPKSGHVFESPTGKPLRRHNWYKRYWRPAVTKAGLDPALRFHDLRHTHASLLVAAGLPVKVIADRLGHSKPSLTLDTYSHVLPALEEQAVDGLEATFKGKNRVQTGRTMLRLGAAGKEVRRP